MRCFGRRHRSPFRGTQCCMRVVVCVGAATVCEPRPFLDSERSKQLLKTAVLAAVTPALAIGHALRKIQCFLVGDDYGRSQTFPGRWRFAKACRNLGSLQV